MTARAATVAGLIDAEYDFTVDEQIPRDADELPWAKDQSELDERWRKRIKFDLLMLKQSRTKCLNSSCPP
jgi:carboxyl-terminal processing protease